MHDWSLRNSSQENKGYSGVWLKIDDHKICRKLELSHRYIDVFSDTDQLQRIDRVPTSSSVMQVVLGLVRGIERFFHTEYGLRLMLAPRSDQGRRLSSFLLKEMELILYGLGLEALTGAFTGSEIDS
ncbi:hypothetical protein Tco_0693457 [Tanacetum coccineum]